MPHNIGKKTIFHRQSLFLSSNHTPDSPLFSTRYFKTHSFELKNFVNAFPWENQGILQFFEFFNKSSHGTVETLACHGLATLFPRYKE